MDAVLDSRGRDVERAGELELEPERVLEVLLFLLVAFAAAAVLWIGGSARARIATAACALLGAAGLWLHEPGGDPELVAAVPAALAEGGFATSATCRACHPQQYESWHRSYHRTMTQVASPESVLGDFSDVVLSDGGLSWRLERRDGEYWIEMPDPLWFIDTEPDRAARPPNIRARVVMTTGSHHQQYYWVRRPSQGPVYRDLPDNGALVAIPWVWMVDEKRWIPSRDSFLTPSLPEPPAVWNTSCFPCHSVGTEPHFDADEVSYATRSAELGIACEACHGPGEEHVKANASPLRRYAAHFAGDDARDPTIVNPSRLDREGSAEVCGQCHSFHRPVDLELWQRTGAPYRAGDELDATRAVFRWEHDPDDPLLAELLESDPRAVESTFWRDGAIRVAGRDYNGLIESPCYQRGEMTCLSCHSMHRYREPADQLAQDRVGNESCLQCHESLRERVAAHTHHAPDSAGSECMNCHMPHTTWGLFTAMRSHRIDSPSVAVSVRTGRPNACNLCHLDRTLEWAARSLFEWYGEPVPALDPDERALAASVLWTVKGDAAQRAITAWHMGWEPAREASGRTWQGAYLALLVADPYVAIRRVAARSLQTLPGFADFRPDFVSAQDASRMQREAFSRWSALVAGAPDRSGSDLLMDARGALDRDALTRLLSQRDTRPIRIAE
jgi:hypothetical protein